MKKLGMISIALVLAIGALGIGYAAWTDEVTISGSVNTGAVCIDWDEFTLINDECVEPPETNPDQNCDPGFTNIRQAPEGKDVGCVEVTFSVDKKTAYVTLHEAYPYYFAAISLHSHNCGTLPAIVKQVRLSYTDPVTGQDVNIALPDGSIKNIPGEDQYGGISNVVQVYWVNNTGSQREPCSIWEDSFWITILQPAKQLSTYRFTITREAIQWNEY